MASPRPHQTSATTQPLTPPADPPLANHASASQTNAANSSAANPSVVDPPPPFPPTSLNDSGKLRRPRDARLIHMLLASLGVTAYQERVPLQLLDFAYRYTSSILQDAVHLTVEGYAGNPSGPGEVNVSGGRGGVELNTVTLQALRLSIASRLHYQFQPGLPKEFLMDIASERNRIALPGVSRGFDSGAAGAPNRAAQNAFSNTSLGGMRLPPERFCLTGIGWNLKDDWESEGEEDINDLDPTTRPGAAGDAVEDEEDAEEEGDGKMEDIFGEDTAMGEGDEEEEDKMMTDA
jgi:transcription initiation factor TFIID subunit 9B